MIQLRITETLSFLARVPICHFFNEIISFPVILFIAVSAEYRDDRERLSRESDRARRHFFEFVRARRFISRFLAAFLLQTPTNPGIHISRFRSRTAHACLPNLHIAIVAWVFASLFRRYDSCEMGRGDGGMERDYKGKGRCGLEGRGTRESRETRGGAGHCMLVTLKFRPRTTFPKSATGEKGEWQEEAELSKFGFIRRAAP